MRQKTFTIKNLALLGVLSALVLVTSMVSFPLGELTRFHLGNIMCLLSGILFGPLLGGLAAGIGSMLYDFTNPLFMPEFWITFIMKFALGFAAGWVARQLSTSRRTLIRYGLPALAGTLLYMVLFLSKTALMQHFVMGNPWPAVLGTVGWLAAVSCLTGAISVAATVLLAPVLQRALQSSGLFVRPAGPSPG